MSFSFSVYMCGLGGEAYVCILAPRLIWQVRALMLAYNLGIQTRGLQTTHACRKNYVMDDDVEGKRQISAVS